MYLAAFAPDAGEVAAAFLEQYPSLLGTALVPDAAGYLYVDRSKFREVFAGDVDRTQARVMAAAQKPINSHISAPDRQVPASGRSHARATRQPDVPDVCTQPASQPARTAP